MGDLTVLETRDLRKSFGGLVAVDSVSLRIFEGSCTSIIGPNGAGKTTLFNVISGFYPPESGKVTFRGNDISGMSVEKISRQGMVRSFQLVSIFPRFTAYESVLMAYLARSRKTHKLVSPARGYGRQETEDALESVGLKSRANDLASELSAGDRKRLEMAMAVIQRPTLLLLDEPTAGMSPTESAETIELVQTLAKERGLTVLFTEHDMSVVFSMSETVRVMHKGKLIAEGSGEEIKTNELVRKVYLGEVE
jgi:branched-chain amino acid transport system ATP-binding protein